MSQSLRVAVADDEPIMQMYLEETVSDFGHEVVAAAGDGMELLEECRSKHPDLVITDIKMPRMDGFRAVQEICRDSPVPVVLITGYDERDRALQAEGECVLVYLMKPVGGAELREAIDLVMQRFEQFKVLLSEAPDERKALADRQRVEHAKAVLKRHHGIDDEAAFELLRDMAQQKDIPIADAAAVGDSPNGGTFRSGKPLEG